MGLCALIYFDERSREEFGEFSVMISEWGNVKKKPNLFAPIQDVPVYLHREK